MKNKADMESPHTPRLWSLQISAIRLQPPNARNSGFLWNTSATSSGNAKSDVWENSRSAEVRTSARTGSGSLSAEWVRGCECIGTGCWRFCGLWGSLHGEKWWWCGVNKADGGALWLRGMKQAEWFGACDGR